MKVIAVVLDMGHDGQKLVGVAATPEAGMTLAEADAGHPIQWKVDADGDFVQAGTGMTGYYLERQEVHA